MGFLDHSTNNIIIDAVLTDKGRELLAANDGSFRIVRYSFADDEVDYTLIKKFGRTIGKEKIEKNTPVFEAQTASSLALKYQLASYSDPSLIALPILRASTLQGDIMNGRTQKVEVSQEVDSDNITAKQRILLQETMMTVVLDSRFLKIEDSSVIARAEPFGFGVMYDIRATSVSSGDTLSGIGFTLKYVANGSSYTQLFSTPSSVKTLVRVIGNTTGVSTVFEATVRY